MTPKVAFFIIESKKLKEEKKSKRQGLILTEVLNLMGIETEYRYIRTNKEFTEMIKQYYKSKFRYLHIAAHGTANGFSFTLDKIEYNNFCEDIVRAQNTTEDKRRLFISACSVKEEIAEVFSKENNTFMSIIAPSINIKTRIAPIAWATFYNKVFEVESNIIKKGKERKMSNKEIKDHLQTICEFYDLKFSAYFRKKKSKKKYEKIDYPKKSSCK